MHYVVSFTRIHVFTRLVDYIMQSLY